MNFVKNALTHWKTSTAGLAAALLIVAQSYQQGMTWKQWGLAAALAFFGFAAPDSSKIVTKLAPVLLLLLLPTFSFAQAVAPAPTQHFSLSGSVVSFMGPGGAAPASIADGYFNLTQNFSVGYQQITVPSIASARLGMGAYSRPLSSWAGKKLTKKFVFDATKINVTLLVGVGKLTQSIDNVNHIAETAGVCVDYPVGGNVSIKLVCGQWLHGGMVNGLIGNVPIPGSSPATQSSTAAISSGVKVHF